MDLILRRLVYAPDGILGCLFSSDSYAFRCDTLEHAYQVPNTNEYVPKIPPGLYVCKRGLHRLEHMTHSFETFEVCEIPGHTNILFHVGNFNKDSDGCILLGEVDSRSPGLVLLNSKDTFERFMEAQSGKAGFLLTVLDDEAPTV